MILLDECLFIVTGATGWLGHVTLEVLGTILGDGAAAHIMAVGSKESTIRLADGTVFPVWPLMALEDFRSDRPLVVFHHAFLTKGRVAEQPLADYIRTNFLIRETVVRLLTRCKVAGLMVPSSGAVYEHLRMPGAVSDLALYGQCKYQDEVVFEKLARELEFRVIIPRIFNLSGHYINNLESYVLSSIILRCLREETVLVRADHPVWRSFYSAADLVRLSLGMLATDSEDFPLVFDTAGEEAVEVGDLAQRCIGLLSTRKLAIERPLIKDRPRDYYVGNPQSIRRIERHVGFFPIGLNRQIIDTADYLRGLSH